jgi:hypothetical protein
MFTFAIIYYILAIILCIFLWVLIYKSLSIFKRGPCIVAFFTLLCCSLGLIIGVITIFIAEASGDKETFY